MALVQTTVHIKGLTTSILLSEVYAMVHLHFNIYKVAREREREIDESITLPTVYQSSNAYNN